MFVARSTGNGRQSLLGHPHEVVLGSRSANCINGDAKPTVGAILKADGERQAGGQLAVELRLGRTRANGPQRDEVGKELGRDRVEHFARYGHAEGGKIAEELAAHPEALVDLIGLIDVRVVDQPLPAYGRARLLEVSSHYDHEFARVTIGELLQPVTVLDRSFWIVYAARADHDKQPVVLLGDDGHGIASAFEHRLD